MNHKKLWSSNFEIYKLIPRFSTDKTYLGDGLLCFACFLEGDFLGVGANIFILTNTIAYIHKIHIW